MRSSSVPLPASAKLVVNESGKLTELWAEWYVDGEGSWGYGYAVAFTQNRSTMLELYEYTSTVIPPAEEGDPWCYESSYTQAWGPGTLVTSKGYESGYAQGVLQGWAGSYVWCEGDWDEFGVMNGGDEAQVTLAVSIDFTATSPLYKEKSSSSFKLPSQFNERYSYSSEYRYGNAEVTFDGTTVYADWAMLGTLSYRYHLNIK